MRRILILLAFGLFSLGTLAQSNLGGSGYQQGIVAESIATALSAGYLPSGTQVKWGEAAQYFRLTGTLGAADTFELYYFPGAKGLTLSPDFADGGVTGFLKLDYPIYWRNQTPIFMYQGGTADAETQVTVTDPTGDRSIAFPDASGTLALNTQNNAFSEAQTITKAGIAATPTDGLELFNTTAATVGVPIQYSPALELLGHGWDTDTGPGPGQSDALSWRIYNTPSTGTTTGSALYFRAAKNAGASTPGTYADAFFITSGGVIRAEGSAYIQGGKLILGDTTVNSTPGIWIQSASTNTYPFGLFNSTVNDAVAAADVVAFILDTDYDVTRSGSNLLQVKNNATTKFAVDRSGTITCQNNGVFLGTVYVGSGQGVDGYANDYPITIQSRNMSTAGRTAVGMATGTHTAASGDSTGVAITPNFSGLSGTAGYTALKIDATDGAGSGTELLFDAKLGGATKFSVSGAGDISAAGSVTGTSINGSSFSASGNKFVLNNFQVATNTTTAYAANAFYAKTNTSGSWALFQLNQTYNQATGTAANTDFLINRTETAVGSGAQYLIDGQVGGVSKFHVDNRGATSGRNYSSILTADAVLQVGMVAMADAGTDLRFDVNGAGGTLPIGIVTGTGPTAQGTAYGLAVAGICYVVPDSAVAITRGHVIFVDAGTAGYVDDNAALQAAGLNIGRALTSEANYTAATAGVNLTNNTFQLSSAPGWAVGDPVVYWNGGGADATGLTSGLVYWIQSITTDTITVAATKGGAAIDITGTGNNAQNFTRLPQVMLHWQ